MHNLKEVSDFGTSSESIGIYIGGHPGYHHSRIDDDTLIKGTRKAELFGKQQEWIEYSPKNSKDWKGLEIIGNIPGLDPYWKTHIFTQGINEKRREKMLKIISTAKIENK